MHPAFTPGFCGSPGVLTKAGPVYVRQDVQEDRNIFQGGEDGLWGCQTLLPPLVPLLHRAEPLATRWGWLFAVADEAKPFNEHAFPGAKH